MNGKNAATLGAAFLTMASSASAHIIMANPVPYGQPNNSPLAPDGSDFPCKNVPFTVNQENEWEVGSEQTLSFTGSAVHNGGSCQLAVTLDREPTASSKFKVIYSIEGGCPGVGAPSTFPFTVPEELPNGQYAMVWTWQNHVGVREHYQNCAPITVTGGKPEGDTSGLETLPDLAVANIASVNPCKTTEGFDYIYDDPGKYVTKIGNGPFQPLCGGAEVPGVGEPNTGTPPASGAPTAAPNNGQYTPPVSQAPASTPAVDPSQAPEAPEAQTSTVHTLITVTAPFASTPSVQPTETPAPPANGGQGDSCSPDGAIVCNGDDQFGICNHGAVVFQPVAAGTKCSNGAITRRDDFSKRDYTHRAQRSRI
ncbi:hypothetical protein CC78DRAFT_566419 [Lojkania enalia]|uniref:Carbohydrate-binding module family 19 domain-containing protein n=1 Tax=Lojkania enalia TaxID=147567 RepID=A0A9P4KFH4_9PLEO|nr:hypothetical protein CC78DRAFT_566419 [Didymosphaeria enalia]